MGGKIFFFFFFLSPFFEEIHLKIWYYGYLAKTSRDFNLAEPMNLTVNLTALSGSNFLILRTFLYMTHYAQTTP